MSVRVSVIIRSKGDTERAALLSRAITSILTQEGVSVELIVVLNGNDYDAALLRLLKDDPRLMCVVLDGPDLARATEVGRSLVTSDFVSFLDDDDEYLPGALASRALYLIEHPAVDCVVTNGVYFSEGRSREAIPGLGSCARDLAGSLLDGHNWLASCGGTFRAKTVSPKYFDHLPTNNEWTVLGFRIASDLNVKLLNERTYRINFTPGSESAEGEAYRRGAIDAIVAIEEWNAEPKRIRKIKRALARAFHELSSFHRLSGNFGKAWQLHWLSVKNGYGWKYLPYSLLLLTRSRRRASEIFGVFVRARG